MKKKKLLVLGLVCAAAAVVAARVRGNAAEEVKGLAALMEWKPGTIAADIGAGDGRYTFAAGERGGGLGKKVSAGIDGEKLAALRREVAESKQGEVVGGGGERAGKQFASGGGGRDFFG